MRSSRPYYLRDAMGSVIGLVNDDGTQHSTIHYDGFGNIRSQSGTLADLPAEAGGDFRFQGMWLEPDTGLYYVRARIYDPQTGRFLSRDPAAGVRSEPETYPPYVFAHGNPYAWSDPTGRFSMSEMMTSVNIQAQLASIAIPAAQAFVVVCAVMSVSTTIAEQFGASIALSDPLSGQCSKKPCPPCRLADGTTVAIGTVGYRYDALPSTTVQHGIAGDHLNLYVANQNPNNCWCFWQRSTTVPPPPQPGWIPIQPFVN